MQADFSNEIEITEMRESDLDEVLKIESRSFPAPWSRKLFEETFFFPLSRNFVVRKKIDNKVVGYANFYLIRDEAQILNIAVDPDLRKRGYATRLLEHSIAFLKEHKAREVFLEVREGNLDALKLYHKFGFRKIGKRKKYYKETGEDAIVMRLKVVNGTDH